MLNPLPFPSAFPVLEGSINLTALDLICRHGKNKKQKYNYRPSAISAIAIIN